MDRRRLLLPLGRKRVQRDYDDGKCEALIIGLEDTSMDTAFLNKMCEKDLVFTESLAAEVRKLDLPRSTWLVVCIPL